MATIRTIYDGPMPRDNERLAMATGGWVFRDYVYLLYSGANLTYVGMTGQVFNRWQAHRTTARRAGDDWWSGLTDAVVLEVSARTYAASRSRTRKLESLLIQQLLPSRNIVGPANLPSKAVA